MSDTQLTVTLSGGGVDDARAVVRALEGTFGAPDQRPSDARATVHVATFAGEGQGQAGRADAGPLSAPVTVTVQGTPEAVRRANDALRQSFRTRDEGAASGDRSRSGNCSWSRDPGRYQRASTWSLIRRS